MRKIIGDNGKFEPYRPASSATRTRMSIASQSLCDAELRLIEIFRKLPVTERVEFLEWAEIWNKLLERKEGRRITIRLEEGE